MPSPIVADALNQNDCAGRGTRAWSGDPAARYNHAMTSAGSRSTGAGTRSREEGVLAALAAGILGAAYDPAVPARMLEILHEQEFRSGIPAGVPDGVTVVHKTGAIDDALDDAALVQSGPQGAYVLSICTKGVGGDVEGWKLLADISRAVWQFESTR